MLARIRPRLNHATVVAYLALLVALGGTSLAASQIGTNQIANNSVRSKDLRNNDVRGKDIRRGAVKGSDVGDNSLTGADIKESRLGVVPAAAAAGAAANANRLDGIDSTGFLRSSPPETYHEVNAPGEPTFGTGWKNDSPNGSTAGFFKDPFDIVHLKGVLNSTGATGIVFTLPAGYRPTKTVCIPTVRTAPVAPGYYCIEPTGNVLLIVPFGAGGYTLDGITFRAGAG